jgi:hypothetical protein
METNRTGDIVEIQKGYIDVILKYGTVVIHGIDQPQLHRND